MKKFLVVCICLMFTISAFAQIPAKKLKNPPEGTFRKQRNGNIVQYNNNGKKIGVYKIKNGKLVQIK